MAKVEGLGKPSQKQYAWSYSKLKNFETCAYRHYRIDVLPKNDPQKVVEPPGEALTWGNSVHEALAKACIGAPLPETMKQFQPWVDRIKEGPGQLFVEQKYAITRDFQPTTYFANDVWYRGIGDIVRVDGPAALVVDWKTGKVLDDSVQLMLMAQCIFSHFPEVVKVRSEFIWLKDDCTSPEVFTRQEVAEQWTYLLDRVKQLEIAHLTQTYPKMPNGLCRSWCPVTDCEHNGRKT